MGDAVAYAVIEGWGCSGEYRWVRSGERQRVDPEFLRKQVYMSAFLEFFDGNIDRKEVFKRIDKFENSDNMDFLPIERITMIDLKTKTQKTVRHIVVD